MRSRSVPSPSGLRHRRARSRISFRRGDELRGLRAAYLIKRAFDDDTVRERASARERERGRLKSGTLIVKYLLYYK